MDTAESKPLALKSEFKGSEINIQKTLFNLIVEEENDIVGLLAFSLHRQSYLAWCLQFENTAKRKPDDKELQSFMIGEKTQYRIRKYRTMAEAMLNLHEKNKCIIPVSLETGHENIEPYVQNLKNNDRSSKILPPKILQKTPDLKSLFKYFIVLCLLVGLLSLSVNYAKTIL